MGMMVAPFRNYRFSSLKNTFACWLQKQGVDLNKFDLQAHPALRYQSNGSYSKNRVLLVGDAAGVDPLFGEGITSALATGTIAAQSAFDAIQNGDFSFSEYEKQIRYSPIGTLMRRRCLVARKLYRKQMGKRQRLQYETLFNWVAPISPEDASATTTWTSS
jgi:flavin-dependent dehydrogenase